MAQPLILTLACPDRPGITARVTGFLFERNCNILDAQQFNDRAAAGGTDRFFMRVVFDPDGSTAEGLRSDFAALAGEFAMEWTMVTEDRPRRTIILVSKFDHCLVDLLYRWRTACPRNIRTDFQIANMIAKAKCGRDIVERARKAQSVGAQLCCVEPYCDFGVQIAFGIFLQGE